MPRVLIAEDDRVIANAMATHLRRAGMDVEVAEDGDRAIAKLRYERPDVAVIDLMLPGTDGWRITETLRAEGIDTPIMIVSARGSEHDKVHALGIGGDDYLSKPFGMRELVARVEAVLRRADRGRGLEDQSRSARHNPGGRGRGAYADRVPPALRAVRRARPRALA